MWFTYFSRWFYKQRLPLNEVYNQLHELKERLQEAELRVTRLRLLEQKRVLFNLK